MLVAPLFLPGHFPIRATWLWLALSIWHMNLVEGKIYEFQTIDFERVQEGGTWIIAFLSHSCPQSRALSPVLEDAEMMLFPRKFGKIYQHSNRALFKHFLIQRTPSIKMFKAGLMYELVGGEEGGAGPITLDNILIFALGGYAKDGAVSTQPLPLSLSLSYPYPYIPTSSSQASHLHLSATQYGQSTSNDKFNPLDDSTPSAENNLQFFDPSTFLVDVTQATTPSSNSSRGHDRWVVYFYASWCPYSRDFHAVFESVVLESQWMVTSRVKGGRVVYGGVMVSSEMGSHHPLADDLPINGYPTLLLFSGGRVWEYWGPRNRNHILAWIKNGYVGDKGWVLTEKKWADRVEEEGGRRRGILYRALVRLKEDLTHVVAIRKNAAVGVFLLGIFLGMILSRAGCTLTHLCCCSCSRCCCRKNPPTTASPLTHEDSTTNKNDETTPRPENNEKGSTATTSKKKTTAPPQSKKNK